MLSGDKAFGLKVKKEGQNLGSLRVLVTQQADKGFPTLLIVNIEIGF
jgi:hypothetical protein